MPDIRLIDANALIKQIKETYCKDCGNYNGDVCCVCTLVDAMDYIDDAPTIDAQPVKHGKWIPMDEYCAKCSVCGWWQKTNGKCCTGDANIHRVAYKYCTACGAKMDGDADEQ